MPEIVIEARQASISTGLNVRRILPFRKRRMVGPFIFMDHAGPVDLPVEMSRAMDVLPHPHIGLSTVSYLFEGRVTHRDSTGAQKIIEPGAVNWMTAGKGISHSERFEDPQTLSGGKLEMIQTWVALPERAEESDPSFENYQPDALPVYQENGIWMRLIAGNAYGLRNNVRIHSPMFYLHARIDEGARFELPSGHSERGIYIAKGSIETGGLTYAKGQMIVFSKNEDTTFIAKEASTLMFLGGEPLGDRFIWWNFVSSRKQRIEQAKADWKAGRIKLPVNDDKVFIPLPDDRSRPSGMPPQAEALS